MIETRRVVEGQAAARIAEAGLVEGAWSETLEGLVVVSLGFAEFWSNVALALWPLRDPEATLDKAAQRLSPHPMCVQVVAGSTPATEAAVRRRGMIAREDFFGFARPIDDLAIKAPRGYTIERVRGLRSLDAYVATQSEGFGDDPGMNRMRHPASILADNRFRLLLARDANGAAAAVARAFVDANAVGISGVTTLARHRRRGLASALVAEAIREGASSGADLAWLTAGEDVAGVYERLGFSRVTALRMFTPAAALPGAPAS